jgi:hypothetical protein
MMATAGAAERHYPPEAACHFLYKEYGIKRTEGTLAKARCAGGDAPHFRRLGRHIYYAESDLRSWAEERLGTVYRTTSDPGHLVRRLGNRHDEASILGGQTHKYDDADLDQDAAFNPAQTDPDRGGTARLVMRRVQK